MSGAMRSVRKGISCPYQDPNCTRIVETLSSWNESVGNAYRLVDLPPATTSVSSSLPILFRGALRLSMVITTSTGERARVFESPHLMNATDEVAAIKG